MERDQDGYVDVSARASLYRDPRRLKKSLTNALTGLANKARNTQNTRHTRTKTAMKKLS